MGGNRTLFSLVLDCFAPMKRYRDNELPERIAAAVADEQEYEEEFENGVYVTVRRSAGGSREVKRVKFSREQFSETQASSWWEENRQRVHQHYA